MNIITKTLIEYRKERAAEIRALNERQFRPILDKYAQHRQPTSMETVWPEHYGAFTEALEAMIQQTLFVEVALVTIGNKPHFAVATVWFLDEGAGGMDPREYVSYAPQDREHYRFDTLAEARQFFTDLLLTVKDEAP